MIENKDSIITALNEQFDTFAKTVAGLSAEVFTAAPGDKWSAGQHLDHLLRSGRPVYMALGLPAFLLRLLFGKPNRPARTYDALVERYRQKLAAGGRASGRFVPPVITAAQQVPLLQQYRQLQQKLTKRITAISDSKLDNYLLPHPLLGKLTLREMLFFTIYHTHHHTTILQQR
jgi:hypothetical protein